MTQQSNDLRERLLAALPQPENPVAYREETAALLAKHATALRWDKITANTLIWIAVALFWWSISTWAHLGALAVHNLQFGSAILFFAGAIYTVRYQIYASQIATLKEIKQVQLQILELQASLQKEQ
jgi:membrane protein insertase Oxa1/YidC/SpoIIIJ